MAFVDEARIFLEAGNGGNGCESFMRNKHMRYPRPDGGDGGKGGDIAFVADKRIRTLLDFRFKQHYKGQKGGHASSKGKTGRNALETLLKVPCGTIIRDFDTGLLIKDLTVDGQRVIVAHGGKGGLGNKRHRTPCPPQPGEKRTIRLELKLIADAGIIGFPNAGKSTLISKISKVKSKIANYPFTTKQPILGIVQGEDFEFCVADMPGLIENAHLGKGLGHRFLKHIERTKILVHVLDMASIEDRDPYEDYRILRDEMEKYSDQLFLKKHILVANKMDVPEAKQNLKRFKKRCKEEILPISALCEEGLEDLIKEIKVLLAK